MSLPGSKWTFVLSLARAELWWLDKWIWTPPDLQLMWTEVGMYVSTGIQGRNSGESTTGSWMQRCHRTVAQTAGYVNAGSDESCFPLHHLLGCVANLGHRWKQNSLWEEDSGGSVMLWAASYAAVTYPRSKMLQEWSISNHFNPTRISGMCKQSTFQRVRVKRPTDDWAGGHGWRM